MNEEIVIIEESKGKPPVILSLEANLEGKFAGDEITIVATTSDPDMDIKNYDWTVSEGSFEKVSDTKITWNSPQSENNHTIELTVTDSEDHRTTDSLEISLEIKQQTFQKIIDASYNFHHSSSNIVVIDDFVYFYSSERNGFGSARRLKKFDLDGNEIWTKTYENTPDKRLSIGKDLFKTPDNNLMVGIYGETLKIDTDGNILWSFPNGNIYNFEETENGNYLFTGSKDIGGWKPHYFLISPNGELIREGVIEKPNYDIYGVYSIVKGPTANTYFVLAGISDPEHPEIQSEVLHIDSDGAILSTTIRFEYVPRFLSRLFKETDGSYTFFFNPEENSRLPITQINFSDSGEILSTNDHSFDNTTRAYDIEQLKEGGYLLAGLFGPNEGGTKSLIFKTTISGDIEWNIEFGDYTFAADFAYSIQELNNGQFLVSGSTLVRTVVDDPLKVYLHKYNVDGSL